MSDRLAVDHKFGPFYRADSELLILGSFPSVKSREEAFYYAHPQNRFWRVLAECFGEDTPNSLEEKRLLLESQKIALWDSIESCEIAGSSDSSIKNAVPTDIKSLIEKTKIKKIIFNGRAAERWFARFNPDISIPCAALPSTSPANASYSLERLVFEWRHEILGG